MSIDVEYLRSVLSYDAETGVFRWTKSNRIGQRSDGIAGCLSKTSGYVLIRVGGTLHRAHRLAWLYVHGVEPIHQVDHINGDRADNRIVNLRVVTNAQNCQNQRRPRADNRVGVLGAFLHRQTGRWAAQIRIDGVRTHLGLFDTPEEAGAAYLAAKREHHPFGTI